jgi:hypothetical protein
MKEQHPLRKGNAKSFKLKVEQSFSAGIFEIL